MFLVFAKCCYLALVWSALFCMYSCMHCCAVLCQMSCLCHSVVSMHMRTRVCVWCVCCVDCVSFKVSEWLLLTIWMGVCVSSGYIVAALGERVLVWLVVTIVVGVLWVIASSFGVHCCRCFGVCCCWCCGVAALYSNINSGSGSELNN